MDGQRFDALAKALGDVLLGNQSRRAAVGTALALLGLSVSRGESSAARRHRTGRLASQVKKKKGGGKGKGKGKGKSKGKQKDPPTSPPTLVCVPDAPSQTCAGKCASIVNNCGTPVDCGPCACTPPCAFCQTCDAVTGQCVKRADGSACGTGVECIDGACSCTTTSCATGCCQGGACHIDDDGACGTGGGICTPCTQPQTCGGGPTPGVCGCTPDCVGKQCGDNGCGGSCGTCPATQTCQGGQCACPAGTVDCGAGCVNLGTDPNNCGSCGTPCTAPGDVCSNGQCVGNECGIGANICPAEGDAACCVAGHQCCAAGTGINGCCGEDDYTCLPPNGTFPQGRCEPICDDDFPVACTNDIGCCASTHPVCCADGAGCCSSNFPVCCADIGFCCPEGTHCGTEANPCLAGSSSVRAEGEAQGTAGAPAGQSGRRMRARNIQARHN